MRATTLVRLTTETLRVIDSIGPNKCRADEIAGWRHPQHFSVLLHSKSFKGTPLILRRLERLGEVLGIDRVFEEVPR